MQSNKANTHTMIALICVVLSVFMGFWAGLVSWVLVASVFELMLLTPSGQPRSQPNSQLRQHLNKE